MSFLVLQSCHGRRDSWLLYFKYLLDGVWESVISVSSSRCYRLTVVYVTFPGNTHLLCLKIDIVIYETLG